MTDALAEVFGEMCSCGCGPRATLHQRDYTVVDEPHDLIALTQIEALLRKAEHDSQLLNAREHDSAAFNEAYRMLGILRRRATSNQKRSPSDGPSA